MEKFKTSIVIGLMSAASFIPLSWLQAIGSISGRLYFAIHKKRRLIAECNIKHCFPEMSDDEQTQLLWKNAEETGKWVCETPFAWFSKPERAMKKTTIKNPEKAKQRGCNRHASLRQLGNDELLSTSELSIGLHV